MFEGMKNEMLKVRYKAISAVKGPLIFVQGVPDVGLGELVKIYLEIETRTGL
jgi:vacuolar-type H+-ATPase subunit B/Vma2